MFLKFLASYILTDGAALCNAFAGRVFQFLAQLSEPGFTGLD